MKNTQLFDQEGNLKLHLQMGRPLVQKVFGEEKRKDLAIPTFINDYNHFMGGLTLLINCVHIIQPSELPYALGILFFLDT